MPNHKHLTLDERSYINTKLNEGISFRQIAHYLDKDPSTISKEVRLHREKPPKNATWRNPNKCIHRMKCTIKNLCKNCSDRLDSCWKCKACNLKCPNFKEEICPLLLKPPYVCNNCEKYKCCNLNKYLYRDASANKSYQNKLIDCRSGLYYTEDEIQYMDTVLTPLIRKKQSIHHICVSQADKILCSERTVYKLVEQGVLTVRNIDLPRKVRYRPRRLNKSFKVDKSCRLGRTFEEYQTYLKENPDTAVVQMDSVEGRKGGKVLLTLFFEQSDLMLIYLRDHNTSQSVLDIWNALEKTLGMESLVRLFPVTLTDNGSEFSNPSAIECNESGQPRTILFYCDPSSPHQKGEIEKSHEFIRMVIPKGNSFDHLVQSDVDLLACHINSYIRKKLNDKSPTTTFSFFHGDTTLHKLGIYAIPPEEVNLTPSLLKACKEVSRPDENL